MNIPSMKRGFFGRPGAAALSFAALMLTASGHAAGPALVEGPGISITPADMQADSLRMPPEMRSIVLAKPQTVSQIASNLYARRAMAQQADKDGLANDPEVQAALRVARDKVLSDAFLAKLDAKNVLRDDVAEGLARDIYKAKPERFKTAEQVRARHILIAGTEEPSRVQAEKVLEDLRAGADFAQVAKEHSADPGSAVKGGDLGFFEAGRMVPEFSEAAFALKTPGDVSGIVKSKFGYHIIKLEDKRPAGTRPFEEVRDELKKEVQANVQHEARVAEAQRLQQGVNINTQAVEAFAATYAASAPAGRMAMPVRPAP